MGSAGLNKARGVFLRANLVSVIAKDIRPRRSAGCARELSVRAGAEAVAYPAMGMTAERSPKTAIPSWALPPLRT
jgi:hypothetical protein